MLTRDSRTTLRQTGYKHRKRSHRPGGNLVHTQARTDDVIRESIFNSENEMQIVKKTFVTVQQQIFEVWGTYFFWQSNPHSCRSSPPEACEQPEIWPRCPQLTAVPTESTWISAFH